MKPARSKQLEEGREDQRRYDAEDAAADEPDETGRPTSRRAATASSTAGCARSAGTGTADRSTCRSAVRCSVVSRGRSEKGEDWGVLVEFADLDGKLHRCRSRWRCSAATPARRSPCWPSAGLHLAGADKCDPGGGDRPDHQMGAGARVTVASKTGWVDGFKAFVLGDGTTIGDQAYVFQPAGAITGNARGMRPRGTVEDWRDGVAALCPATRC